MSRHPDEPTPAQVQAAWPAIMLVAATVLRVPAEESLLSQLAAPPPNFSEQLARLDRLCGLAVVASLALHSKLPPNLRLSERVAVICASADGCLTTDAAFYRGVLRGEASPRLFAYTLHSSPVGAVSIQHGYTGPGYTLMGSPVTGLQGLCAAQDLLASRQADACLILSCDVAALPGQLDRAAALLFLPSEAVLSQPGVGTVHAVCEAYRSGRGEEALQTCLSRVSSLAGCPSGLPIIRADEPPLLTLADRCSGHGEPRLDAFLLAALDASGQAAAAWLSVGS